MHYRRTIHLSSIHPGLSALPGGAEVSVALAITDDHQALADVVRSFASAGQLRGISRAMLDESSSELSAQWTKLGGLGWLGLHVPEEFGGSGFGLPELAVVADELGYAISPGPFLPTVVTSAVLV